MNVGLTGGIASGKSTVSRLLAERGAHIVDADRIAREIVFPGQPALLDIVQAFGDSVLNEDGSLNRKRLGQLVFEDEAMRKTLESILHPRIRAEMKRQIADWSARDPGSLVVADIPLLFESGLERHYDFDHIIVVYTPAPVQLERLMQREGMSEADARKRIGTQLPMETKRERADVVIDNSGTPEETERQVELYLAGRGSVPK